MTPNDDQATTPAAPQPGDVIQPPQPAAPAAPAATVPTPEPSPVPTPPVAPTPTPAPAPFPEPVTPPIPSAPPLSDMPVAPVAPTSSVEMPPAAPTTPLASSSMPVPEAPTGWNWGAFWLTWVWGCFHGVWISLLALIPGLGFIMAFVLGAKGTKWAWENDKDKDLEKFKASQHKWAKWGLIITIVSVVLTVAGVVITVMLLSKLTEAPRKAALEFTNDIKGAKYTEAYALTDANFKTTVTSDTFAAAAAPLKSTLETCTPVGSAASAKSSSTNGVTTNIVNITISCNSKALYVAEMSYENGIWKVANVLDTSPTP